MRTLSIILSLILAATCVADDYVVVVLDTSGSMGDHMRSVRKSRMEVAQDALIKVVREIPPTTNVGILTFDKWIYDLKPVNLAEIEKAIRSTRPGGGTPLYGFMAKGATRLLEERQKNGNVGFYKLVVATDGAATDPELNREGRFRNGAAIPGVLTDVLMRGIVVDVIGLDLGQDHDLATKINGKYMKGDNPTGLEQALKKAVAEVGFGTTKDASDEAFKEISELPPDFVTAALTGLTTFPNYPIGEQPPKKAQPAPGFKQSAAPPSPAAGMSSGVKTVLIVGGIVAGVLLVIGIVAGCSQDY
jgi:hypothetical protein